MILSVDWIYEWMATFSTFDVVASWLYFWESALAKYGGLMHLMQTFSAAYHKFYSAIISGLGRIALLPFWALAVLVSKIPFGKGYLENPFSPSINTTFCPVLWLLGPFGEPSMSFMHVFCMILVSNLIDNYYLVKFSALCASLCIAESCCPILQTVSKHFLGVTWLE